MSTSTKIDRRRLLHVAGAATAGAALTVPSASRAAGVAG